MVGQRHHTHLGGMVTHATLGIIGAVVQYTTHIGVGVGAMVGEATLITQDIFLRTITTTTTHHTMAAVEHITDLPLRCVQIVHSLVVDLCI